MDVAPSDWWKLALSFNDKLFSLVVKNMEAMDPSILKGEGGSGKKHKVPASAHPAHALSHLTTRGGQRLGQPAVSPDHQGETEARAACCMLWLFISKGYSLW